MGETTVAKTQPEKTGNQLDQIAAALEAKGEKHFRIDQVRKAWYTESGWDAVTTLSKELRSELSEQFPWTTYIEARSYTSPKDGTQKALLTLKDGQKIETVYMPNARGSRTVCISSQVGCAMACTFCATGTMGLMRNLSADEIVDQVRFWKMTGEEPITNIVYMGMGEPLANFEAVKAAAHIFIDAMEIGSTRITVSTVGFPMGLQQILKDTEFPHVRVAFSLHAGTDATRASIVPTHKMTSMQKIIDWVEQYLQVHGNNRHHLTLEYVMLLDVNDMPSEAKALVKLFSKFGAQIKLNLIPWNHTDADLHTSSEARLEAFQKITEDGGIPTTIRYSKGLDIAAACGQLVVDNAKACTTE